MCTVEAWPIGFRSEHGFHQKLDNILYGYLVSDLAVFYLFSEYLNEVQYSRQSVCSRNFRQDSFQAGQVLLLTALIQVYREKARSKGEAKWVKSAFYP